MLNRSVHSGAVLKRINAKANFDKESMKFKSKWTETQKAYLSGHMPCVESLEFKRAHTCTHLCRISA